MHNRCRVRGCRAPSYGKHGFFVPTCRIASSYEGPFRFISGRSEPAITTSLIDLHDGKLDIKS